MKVSIIIPIYNVQKYLNQCIDSVINQSYKELEIILIDDGSTDDSSEIADKWEKRDERIIVIHKKNGGLSSARNVGISVSTGEAVFFLDSDDLLFPNTISVLVSELEDYNVDIVSTAFIAFENDEEAKNIIEDKPIFSRGENKLFFWQRITNHSCGKLIKKDLIDGIYFPEGRSYEDIATTHYYYSRANKVSYTEAGLYLYRIHQNSITYNIGLNSINDIKAAYDDVKKTYPLESIYCFYLLTILYVMYSRLMRSDLEKSEKIAIKKSIRKEFMRIYKYVDFYKYKNESPMFWKLFLYRFYLTDISIIIVDLYRKNMKNI